MAGKLPWIWRQRLARVIDWPFALLVVGLLRLLRLLPADVAIAAGAWLARTLGPLFSANRVGRGNLRAAFPDKSPNEIEAILRGVWDNLGRTAVEYVFLDRIFDYDQNKPDAGRIEAAGRQCFLDIRDSDRPCILFTGHFANWELLAVMAEAYDLDMTVLFRPPNNAYLARRLDEIRGRLMGGRVASRRGALIELGGVLERGKPVGLLVDQFFWRGVEVPFFGRPAATNPALAKLARRYDALVYAARAIRLPGGRFRLELDGPIELPRDAHGEVDVAATMARVTQIIEGWAREHPEQWLWLHRRWRDSSRPQDW